MLVALQSRLPVASGAERLDPPGPRQHACHDLPGSTPSSPASGKM